jgi:hypothetical protein
VPTAAEVDPETPAPVAPFRFVPIAPSFAGLPLRLTCAPGAVVSLLAELVLADAFDRIQLLALAPAADALAVGLCATPLPGMTHPVSVSCCAALLVEREDEDDGVRLRVVVACPLRLEGVDCVVGWVPDVCG